MSKKQEESAMTEQQKQVREEARQRAIKHSWQQKDATADYDKLVSGVRALEEPLDAFSNHLRDYLTKYNQGDVYPVRNLEAKATDIALRLEVLTLLRSTINVFITEINRTLRQRLQTCLLYTSPSPRDRQKSRMPSSA